MMSEAKTKADLVRDYGESEAHKSFLAQIDTTVDEETLFQEIMQEGRDQSQKYSEVQKVKAWYDMLSFVLVSIDDSTEGGKLFKEYVKDRLSKNRDNIISGDGVYDFQLYTEFDMKKIKIACRRKCKGLLDECIKSHTQFRPPEVQENPYKPAE
jgi:hypothetical protein